jgi:hypothetical protein
MGMAKDMLYLHLRLIQSALDQKAEAKLVGTSREERSQGRPAMGGREVASLPGEMESHLGRIEQRASSLLAKFGLSAWNATGRAAAHAVSGALIDPVVPVATSSTGNARFTDEVPRRPNPRGRVSRSYKLETKGCGQASEAGTAFPRPRPKGCQQRQSRGSRPRRATDSRAGSERQNLRVPSGLPRFMGPVSPAIAAPNWPGGTSSCQLAGPLSNSPQQPRLRPGGGSLTLG